MEIQGNKNWPGTNCWRCLVCCTPQLDLLILPCTHKFCENCLHTWLGIYATKYAQGNTHGQFSCQICWTPYMIPPEGTQVYKQNYQVAQLESQLDHMTMNKPDNISHEMEVQGTNTNTNNTDNGVFRQSHSAPTLYNPYKCYCMRGHHLL